MKRHPHRGGLVAVATRDEPCQRIRLPVPSGVRLRLQALEHARAAAGGAEKAEMPHPSALNPEERQYLAEIRRKAYQGTKPQPGSVGPAPWYLRLSDAADYHTQRLAMHRQERGRLERLQATGEHVRSPTLVVADCLEAWLGEEVAPTPRFVCDDWIQASVPVRLVRYFGGDVDGRNIAGLLAWLPKLVEPYGLTDDELETLRSTVSAMESLPPPNRMVLTRIAAAVIVGLPRVEQEDKRRAGRGGLASRLPPADVWACSTWERLREQGRDVPPLPWR